MSAVATLVPVEQYLATSYSPDCEYVDGEIVDRNLGEFNHSFLQSRVLLLFGDLEKRFPVLGLTEQRLRVADAGSRKRIRIPDVCLMRRPFPKERVLTTPPLLVIEVLSPEDRLHRVLEKVKDYIGFGVGAVWVVDPAEQALYRADLLGLHKVPDATLPIPELGVELDLRPVFAELEQDTQ